MSKEEKEALNSHRQKKYYEIKRNQFEIDAYRKYKNLSYAYNTGKLTYNEAESSQQDAGSDEESRKAFEEWKVTANSLTERLNKDVESWGMKPSDEASEAESD